MTFTLAALFYAIAIVLIIVSIVPSIPPPYPPTIARVALGFVAAGLFVAAIGA